MNGNHTMQNTMWFRTLFGLITFSLSEVTALSNKELALQNKHLTAAMKRMEKKLEELEGLVSECRATNRRQLYEGPVTFTYKLVPKKLNVHENAAIVFPTRITDMGGGYDNSTGIYTAPQPGIYMFSCSLLADHDSHSNPMLHASIMVDGVSQAKVFAFSEASLHRDQGANTIFVNLKKGSKVWVKAIDSSELTIGGDEYSTFSGYLLWQF